MSTGNDYTGIIVRLEAELDTARKELELNKKMLARQCDLSRGAETELERLQGLIRKWKRARDLYLGRGAEGYLKHYRDLSEAEAALLDEAKENY